MARRLVAVLGVLAGVGMAFAVAWAIEEHRGGQFKQPELVIASVISPD